MIKRADLKSQLFYYGILNIKDQLNFLLHSLYFIYTYRDQ